MPVNYRAELVHEGAGAGKPELAALATFYSAHPAVGTFQIDIKPPPFTLRRAVTDPKSSVAVTQSQEPLMQNHHHARTVISMASLGLSVFRFLLWKFLSPCCASVPLWFISLSLLLTACATPYIDPGASSLISGTRLTGQAV